jgi:Domain of unknown function (DUF6473)
MKLWYPDYQPRDYEIVDYERFYVDGCNIPFRGPAFNPFKAAPNSYFTCLGAVQTYGAWCERPFPALLGEAIGLPALNLAVGGVGPGFYTLNERLIEAMNRGRFVILQCMAARHAGNSRFAPDGFVEFVIDKRVGDSIPSWAGWKRVIVEEPENALRYVEETRCAWIEVSLQLLARIRVPVIFFYFSRRPAEYQIDFTAIEAQREQLRRGIDSGPFVDGLMGDFPHLVDGRCVREVAAACAGYAECLSARGMGQALLSRFTGRPIGELEHSALGDEFVKLPRMSHNTYYPSSQMHEDARDALLPAARKLLAPHLTQ